MPKELTAQDLAAARLCVEVLRGAKGHTPQGGTVEKYVERKPWEARRLPWCARGLFNRPSVLHHFGLLPKAKSL